MDNETKHALVKDTMLREFRIEKVLGAGGFGITYLAEDTNLKRHVAIKEYFPTELAWREHGTKVVPRTRQNEAPFVKGVESFMLEARKLAKFKHPNIVTIHNFFPANGTAYFVMPYYEGETLEEYMARKKATIPEKDLLAIIRPILKGLEAVHEEKILHRDITPGNIYLRNNGEPLLIDFGAARVAVGKASRSLTMVLTPGYAPMEQYNEKGARQGPWSDIYALGAVMYHCINGDPPPPAPERLVEIYGEKDPYKPAIEVGAGKYSKPFLSTIDRALEVRTVAPRPQSVKEFRKLLGEEKPLANKKARAETAQQPSALKTWKGVAILFGLLTTVLLITTISLKDEAAQWEDYYDEEYDKRNQLQTQIVELNTEIESLKVTKQNELQDLRSSIKKINYPNVSHYPISIKRIEFANTDQKANIITEFGEPIYKSRLQFIQPKIYYDSFLSTGKTVKFYVRIYDSTGEMVTGSSSPIGYSYAVDEYISSSARNQSRTLSGWGNSKGTTYSKGWHRFELWYEGSCIALALFYIK